MEQNVTSVKCSKHGINFISIGKYHFLETTLLLFSNGIFSFLKNLSVLSKFVKKNFNESFETKINVFVGLECLLKTGLDHKDSSSYLKTFYVCPGVDGKCIFFKNRLFFQ